MLGWVVLGKTPRSLPGPRGYNSVNYHLIYYGKRGNLWHGECMRSTECLLVSDCDYWVMQCTIILSFTLLYCLLHYYTVFCTIILSFTLLYCLLHYYTVFYTIILSFTCFRIKICISCLSYLIWFDLIVSVIWFDLIWLSQLFDLIWFDCLSYIHPYSMQTFYASQMCGLKYIKLDGTILFRLLVGESFGDCAMWLRLMKLID